MSGKRILIALAWVAGAMLVTIGLISVFQRSLIYLPSQAVPDAPPDVEEVTYTTDDGITLSGWLVAAPEAKGTVIVFNGNAGNRSHRLPLGRALAERGYTVLLTDYRGYGGNPGSPSEDGLATDARAALGLVEERANSEPLVYFGESLGAGVAMGLARDHPPAALVLRSPFPSLPEVAAVHYWWLPSSLLLRDRYPNRERIGSVHVPVMVIAGSEDTIVPPDLTRSVYETANEPKQLLVVDGAHHNDIALLDGDMMIDATAEFLTEHLNG